MDKRINILLINPPWEKPLGDMRAKFKVVSCLPSLGLGYLASSLEKKGHEVNILDLNIQRMDASALAQFLMLKDSKPSFVGITSTATTIYRAFEIAEVCKIVFPDAKVVLGGVQPTVMPEVVLSNKFVDYVIRGEGEYVFLELIEGRDIRTIQGLSYKIENKFIHNPNQAPIQDLDKVPFPAYHLFSINKYHPPQGLFRRLPAINLITSRGCPFRCTYCATQTIWPGKIRFRSIDNVIEELRELVARYRIREISFSDDTLVSVRSRIVELCEKILKNGINITWSCNAIVNFVDQEVLRLMKKAGCHHICYGIESADQQILKNINKHIKLEDAREAMRLTKRVGISCRASFMFGNPGETSDSMKKTLDFALASNPDFALFNITTPYPGTPLYQWAKEKGYLISEDYSLYTASKCLMNLPTVSSQEIDEFTRFAWKKFYSRPSYCFERILKIRSIYDLKAYGKAFFSLLRF